MLNEDHSEFWKKWKSFGDTYNTTENQNSDGERWENYFKKLYDDKTKHPLPTLDPPQADLSQLNAPFTMEELMIVRLEKGLSVGPFGGYLATNNSRHCNSYSHSGLAD